MASSSSRTRTYPGGVLLPPAFIIGQLTRGQWGPAHVTAVPTPQADQCTKEPG